MSPKLFLLTYFFIISVIFPSIKIVNINDDYSEKILPEEILPSKTREVIDYDADWEAFAKNNPEEKIKVKLPLVFSNNTELVFKNTFTVRDEKLEKNNLILKCSGITYFAEISINEQTIIKHPYGNLPFAIEIPNEILNYDGKNVITIVVKSKLSSETFPPIQRYLFPDYLGGIFGDIKILYVPKNGIEDFGADFRFFAKRKTEYAQIDFLITAKKTFKSGHNIKITLFGDSLNQILSEEKRLKTKSKSFNFNVLLKNPKLWSPSNPSKYYAKIQIYENEKLVDEVIKTLPIYKFEKTESGLILNNKPFRIVGVNYVPFSKESNPDFSYRQIKKDLLLAKNLGFNFIRFANQIPDSKILAIANSLGLLTSVEIPINYLPEGFLNDDVFQKVLNGYYTEFVKAFAKNPYVFLLGAGSSFLPSSEIQIGFVNDFAKFVKDNSRKLSYASFLKNPLFDVNTDFIGVEFYSTLDFENLTKNRNYSDILITGTYPAFKGNKSGSLSENSYEAQGAFFKKFLTFAFKKNIPAVFINSLTDYSGDYKSLYTSYDKKNVYKIGIVGIDRKAKRIGYNVIKQYLDRRKNLVIPLGSKKEKTPLVFVIVPLLLALLGAFTLNSRNKFREDAKRALFRSYNFFADIRDLRLLSGMHSYIIFIINSATLSLLIENILFYFRSSIAFDKILTALGSKTINDFVVYLAWHPVNSFFIFFGVAIAGIVVITLIIKFFSVFNTSRVFLSNIFYTVVWALMPITLLIPLELLLLKILYYGTFNFWIILFLSAYLFWLLLRIFKGVYIIFDNRKSVVYSYGFGIIFILLLAFVFTLHSSTSAIDYLWNAIEQSKYLY